MSPPKNIPGKKKKTTAGGPENIPENKWRKNKPYNWDMFTPGKPIDFRPFFGLVSYLHL